MIRARAKIVAHCRGATCRFILARRRTDTMVSDVFDIVAIEAGKLGVDKIRAGFFPVQDDVILSVEDHGSGSRAAAHQGDSADDVFVCYSRRDAADYALALSSEVSGRGYSCFLDQRLNEPGRALGKSVIAALSQCSMMVLIVSPGAAQYVDGATDAARSRDQLEGTHPERRDLGRGSSGAPSKRSH